VDCRIQVVQEPQRCTIRLAGRLNDVQVYELFSVCARCAGQVRIDLTDLLSADAVGLDALRRLRIDGAQLVGVAQYLRDWLG
jgi:ABC-type transporter Mla MlaB component